MANCNFNDKLQALYDGELSAADAAAFQNHLDTCPPCAAQLAGLQSLSQLFSAVAIPPLSQIGLHRLHQRVNQEMDRGLIKMGWALSGIAAAIMLLASMWLLRVQSAEAASPQSAPPWVGVSASLETASLAQDAGTPTAEWYLADASHGREEFSR